MRGSVVLAVGALVALGACLDIPPQPDGPGGVGTVDYTIELGTGGGQYPAGLAVEGVSMLAESLACGDEGGWGVADLPAYQVDGRGALLGTVDEVLDGAVHKVVLDWTRNTCDAEHIMNGHSLLTWFPDGHIVRFDHPYQDTAPTGELPTSCGTCGTAAQWHVSAYLAIADVADKELGTGSPFMIEDLGLGTNIPNGVLCVTTSTHRRIAFRWPQGDDARARTVDGATESFSVDLLSPSDTQDMVSFGVSTATHMMVATEADSTCADLVARLDAFQNAPGDLEVNGVVDSTSFQDGIFGSEEEDPYMIADNLPVRLHAQSAIAGGFAVLLHFTQGGPASLTVMGMNTDDYAVMTVNNTDRVVWFRNGLGADGDLFLTQH